MTDETLAAKTLEVHARLAEVYELDERAGRLSPVDELVCTILSQNTTDVARDKAFGSLRAAFPDWQDVREAPVAEVEELIRVCGLANQKAPRIQRALDTVAEHTGGELTLEFLRDMPPDEARKWLTSIKGVGIKTASIVLLFAMDIPAMPVDTHVHRVSRRLGLIPDKMTAAKAHHALEALVPPELYLPFHVRLIRHGRTTCKAPRPKCDACPITDLCAWFAAQPAP